VEKAMKKNISAVKSMFGIAVFIGVALLLASCQSQRTEQPSSPPASTDNAPAQNAAPSSLSTLKLQTTAFADGATIPTEYSCSGAGGSPPLSWTGVPPEAKNLALLVTDPDAPSGTWTHWMLWNLPPTATSLPANVPPQEKLASGARQGKNSSGGIGYTPPCPPPGKPHRYIFTLYALDREVDLSGVTISEYSAALGEHAVAQGTIMGRFGR
jgi:Raf kinase inhibitor-like YbhB/YbcL family protein